MAEYVMRDLVDKAGCGADFRIDSAATSNDEIGNPVHPGTQKALARHGVPCGDHRARRVRASDYDEFDLIIGMDEANMNSLERMFGGDSRGKVRKLLSFVGEDRDVADPWFTGDFETTYRDVFAGCKALFEHVCNDSSVKSSRSAKCR